MVGKTNVYDFSFNKSLSFSTSNTIVESDFTASDGLTYDFYSSSNGWELVIYTSGTITFNKNFSADIFLVGGGKNGGNGAITATGGNASTATGGNGGAGGETKYQQINIISGQNYPIVIGDNTNNTSGFNTIAISGGGCAGGTGNAASGGNGNAGIAATAGTTSPYYAFYEKNSSHFYPAVKFGAGGGGAGARGYNNGGYYVGQANGAVGGNTGGGKGASTSNDRGQNGTAGTAHYGAGGGGGSAGGTASSYHIGTGGAGGTGVIIMHPMGFTGW